MAFNANILHVKGQENVPTLPSKPTQLSARELEILLILIKKSQFFGEDIEVLYNMVVKLQNQYIEQTK